jgi:hypothetical protein
LAADYIEARLKEFDQTLYVYKDYLDGSNNFTQKAWMGDSYDKIPAMSEDAEGRSGSTGILAEINFEDHNWGGYMFINGILKAGKTVPALDFGDTDAGLNLTGADKLVFYARGENGGERVEFFLGGLGVHDFFDAPYADTLKKATLGFITLEKNWTRYEIPLIDDDLSRVACGFAWMINQRNNRSADSVRFYLDDIHFEFSEAKLRPMFLTSYAPAPPGTDAAVINNAAYLYDNALAVLALSYAGKHDRAGQIADAIVYAVDNDRYFTDGRVRNAYNGSSPISFPGWYSSRNLQFARLPNFYDKSAGISLEDFYMVGTTSGNCAWAILALMEVYVNNTGQVKYLNTAKQIADFVLTLQTDIGFTGGYEGWEGNQTKIKYKSTEHNADLVAAFGRLAILTNDSRYRRASESARAFVLTMRDPEKKIFYTGTNDDGVTINSTVIPLDCQTWTLLALKEPSADNHKVVDFIEQRFAVDGGYDFDADSKDGVWNEGTAQVGVLYQRLGLQTEAKRILDYLEKNRLPDGSLTSADRDGVTTGFYNSGGTSAWTYDRRQHLGATAWLAFLQQGREPFAFSSN